MLSVSRLELPSFHLDSNEVLQQRAVMGGLCIIEQKVRATINVTCLGTVESFISFMKVGCCNLLNSAGCFV